MGKKAALVIGVNTTGNLPTLKSAAAGAVEVAEWLEGEQYDVACITDLEGPVDTKAITDALTKFVTVPPRYELLLVYFSGHGYWKLRSDIWLLSGAPVSTSEAINLDGAMDLARYSGIPNVVFVSDACRSLAEDGASARVQGIDAFPNYREITSLSKIDFFKATSDARPAYEGKVDGKVKSVLTHALMSAFQDPPRSIVRTVELDGQDVSVVLNRQLESYLQTTVNDILAGIDINLTQAIEANVPSGEHVFIAQIHKSNIASLGQPSLTLPTWQSDSGSAAANALGDGVTAEIDRQLSPASRSSDNSLVDGDTELRLRQYQPSDLIDHFETESGFVVQGARVEKAITAVQKSSVGVDVFEVSDATEPTSAIRLWGYGSATSIAVQLTDGRVLILAALDGYIGHAHVDELGLYNVSYVPSSNHWRWSEYESRKENVDRLRALVALAVNDNTFSVKDVSQAERLGQQIRMGKALDPTLGLYAAHAFSQMGEDSRVSSIRDYMRPDLGADLFDLRVLLARDNADMQRRSDLTVPCCPMLTQTWNLLRPRGIELHDVLHDAMPWLCNSLWTTFRPEAADSIITAFEQGEFQ